MSLVPLSRAGLTAALSFAPPSAQAAVPTATPYVSPFERLLRYGRAAALALLFVWALTCFWQLRSVDEATRVIGHDTAPSITAAERIRGLLSGANRNLALMTLLYEPESGPLSSAFRADIADAEALLVDAAQNITYGDAEKTPITIIMQGVAEYDRLVGAARTAGSAHMAQRADALMRTTVLPATEALDAANFDQMAAYYDAYLSSKTWRGLLAAAASLVTLAGLLAWQWRITRYARRLVNPGLAAATAIVALFSLYALAAASSASENLKIAKTDAFDSIYALTTLLAAAHEVSAAEGFWLLSQDDPAARRRYDDLFRAKSSQIVNADAKTALAAADNNAPIPGLLGDELSNLTFVGEREAALAALRTWFEYLAAEAAPRRYAEAGQIDMAAEVAGGAKPGQANAAFGVFEREVEMTIKINQNAFDDAIARSEAEVNSTVYFALLSAWLLASAAVWFGVHQRLRDYEF